MSDQSPIPIVDGQPLDEEDKQLIALFDKLEEGQLVFLDEAGKRVIELSTAMLAVLWGVTAFGADFPPPYLKGNLAAKALASLTLLAYMLALLAGVLAVQPRTYRHPRTGLTTMARNLKQMVQFKTWCFRIGTWLIVAGGLFLVILLGLLIWQA